MRTTEESYTVTLQAKPGGRIAPILRLRAALKRLGRDYGLRCVGLTQGQPVTLSANKDNANAK